MKLLTKNINTVFFAYFVLLVLWLLFLSNNNEIMSFHFVIFRDLGNILGAVIITYLVYIFSKNNNEEEKFLLIKKVYQAALILVILNFSKTIAMLMIDIIQIVQNTFFSNSKIINVILDSIK